MKTVDAALLWYTGSYPDDAKAFFFFGDEYTRWDVRLDIEDRFYPKKIKDGWPGLWESGIDAAVLWPVLVRDASRNNKHRRKAYFFKGPSYIRWDVWDDTKDGEWEIKENWSNWPAHWDKVDAALAYSEERVFFFSGSEYSHFEIKKDQFTWLHDIGDKWPRLPAQGIQAAVNWPKYKSPGFVIGHGTPTEHPLWTEFGKAYFFFGRRYVRYDIKKDAPDLGPLTIEDGWPARRFCVFAAFQTSNPDADARLYTEDGKLVTHLRYPDGTPRGQAGWHLGIDLSRKGAKGGIQQLLADFESDNEPDFMGGEKIEPGTIDRLGLCFHGYPGQVSVYGQGVTTLEAKELNAGWSQVKHDLRQLEKWLKPDATVLLLSCRAGAGNEGKALLVNLSLLWPGRTVVAFWTIGFILANKMTRRTALFGPYNTNEAGMRDTDRDSEAVTIVGTRAKKDFEDLMDAEWNDLDKYPWASEDSLHARAAKDGKMIRDTYPYK